MRVLVGCCGFSEAQKKYYGDFPVVEVQQTFFQPPLPATAEKWRREAPEDFLFTLKAWQLITHDPSSTTYLRLSHPILPEKRAKYGSFRPSAEVHQAWQSIRDLAVILRAPVILFQSPPSFPPTKPNIRNLRFFFSTIDRGRLKIAWEVGGRWDRSLLEDLCGELDLIHAVDPFQEKPRDTGPVYFRLHGRASNRYRFTEGDLLAVMEACSGRKGVVLFNNVSMREDALRFQEMMKEEGD